MPRRYVETIDYWRLIHNDLEAVSDYYSGIADRKANSDDLSGISLDLTSAAAFRAFYHEALVNFVGSHILEDGWPERASFLDKVLLLDKVLKLGLERGKFPLQQVAEMHKFRDKLAHGKPDIGSMQIEIDPGSQDHFAGMKSAWKNELSIERDLSLRKASEEFTRKLVNGADIKPYETVTRVHGSTSVENS